MLFNELIIRFKKNIENKKITRENLEDDHFNNLVHCNLDRVLQRKISIKH